MPCARRSEHQPGGIPPTPSTATPSTSRSQQPPWRKLSHRPFPTTQRHVAFVGEASRSGRHQTRMSAVACSSSARRAICPSKTSAGVSIGQGCSASNWLRLLRKRTARCAARWLRAKGSRSAVRRSKLFSTGIEDELGAAAWLLVLQAIGDLLVGGRGKGRCYMRLRRPHRSGLTPTGRTVSEWLLRQPRGGREVKAGRKQGREYHAPTSLGGDV
jgi:hypothetical protein